MLSHIAQLVGSQLGRVFRTVFWSNLSPLISVLITSSALLTAKLQEAGTAGTQRMLELAQEWERHRQPLVDALLEKEEVLNKVGSGEYSSVVSRGVVLSVLYG
jgi:hypothetical protein